MNNSKLSEILATQDSMSIEDANVIADAINGGNSTEILDWLRDVVECDGTPNDSKFAAILRGMLLKQGATQ